MKIFFHEEALAEVERAVDYYENCRDGLGMEFSKEVYWTIDRMIRFPDAWSPLSKNTRRCLVSRFPFGVICRVMSGCLHIIAIADLRRRPQYWLDRD